MEQFITRRVRKPLPDVPEDVDVHLAHLNDPNYSFDSPAWTRDSFELDNKDSIDLSAEDRKHYDFDVETQSDYSAPSSRIATSRAPFKTAEEIDDESPYPEVRAAVPNTDDPDMPVNTFRAWFLGLTMAALLAAINQFFSSRFPTVYVTSIIIQLVALPLGKLLEYTLPTLRFRIPIPFTSQRWVFSLNPGPFNIKEHVLITVMANISGNGAYATDIFLTQRIFYGMRPTLAYQIFSAIGSQLLGYSFAGITRRYLVFPSAMIWPGALVNSALFSTLHQNYGRRERKHISRERFFVYAMLCSFVWCWFPSYLFTALSFFNWACWIAPQNPVVNALFGNVTGLGMGVLTFDWSMIVPFSNPLVTPWWAQLNVVTSLVIFYWILSPILYFKNVFYSKYMPISVPFAFDNTGAPYDMQRVIVNGTFDESLYQQYSPIFLPTTFVISYGMSFAVLSAVVVHLLLWYPRDLVRHSRRSIQDGQDVHSRLMLAYREAPDWWYGLLGMVAFVIGLIVMEVYNIGLPIWAYITAILVSVLYIIPIGIIQAVTNQGISLNVMSEALGGALVPNRPVAVMWFKTYGFIVAERALTFTGDLKLGHYMKIPPQLMFSAQTISTVISCLVVIGVQNWQIENIPDFCDPHNKQYFTCPSASIFNTAAVLWGGIGAKRIFGRGAMFFALLGALLPIPFYLAARRWPTSKFKYVNIPVFLSGPLVIPVVTGTTVASWAIVGFIFQYWARNKYLRWWIRYNYILSTALDSGMVLGLLVIFFTVQLPKGGINLEWWGNTVWQNTADAMGLPFLQLAPNSTFGPETW